ncbi:hypothetical protein GGE67_000449 [Rhizobium leucaenae]|uniref:Mandelate racemase/muconate lactonizing enzyme N-terminal domain-containing protein n=1 Tax=Rhizobium leucaenae TaxID=29450 RepID=A0A7W7EMA1_9HYPH|nr:hypothetical protein [Rhizobium leucaenae]MBB6299856.1 hypothetical protein [Rhizobium leucaenae]
MKIAAIELYEYKLTYSHGTYVMSKGRAAKQQPSNLVRIITDNGIEGWGEAAILSGNYLPLFAGGTREALRELAPYLIGEDPRALNRIQNIMSSVLTGQNNAKSAFDVACWDIFGRSVDLPISALLGGVLSTDLPIFESIPLASTEDGIAFMKSRSGTEEGGGTGFSSSEDEDASWTGEALAFPRIQGADCCALSLPWVTEWTRPALASG